MKKVILSIIAVVLLQLGVVSIALAAPPASGPGGYGKQYNKGYTGGYKYDGYGYDRGYHNRDRYDYDRYHKKVSYGRNYYRHGHQHISSYGYCPYGHSYSKMVYHDKSHYGYVYYNKGRYGKGYSHKY